MAIPQVLLFLLLWLAVLVGFSGCFVDSVADIAQQTTLDFQNGCAETAQFAQDKAHSMADWTYDQILQNKDNARQAAQDIKNKAGDAASRASETIKSAASGTSEYISQMSGEAKDKLSRTKAYEKTADFYNEVDGVIKMATDKVSNNAKDILADSVGYEGRDKTAAEEIYNQAKQGVENAYRSAKDTLTEESKVNYEEAKEKASQATGDLGASMRDEH